MLQLKIYMNYLLNEDDHRTAFDNNLNDSFFVQVKKHGLLEQEMPPMGS